MNKEQKKDIETALKDAIKYISESKAKTTAINNIRLWKLKNNSNLTTISDENFINMIRGDEALNELMSSLISILREELLFNKDLRHQANEILSFFKGENNIIIKIPSIDKMESNKEIKLLENRARLAEKELERLKVILNENRIEY